MSKILSESDANHKLLEFPAKSFSVSPLLDGPNSVEFVAFDMLEQQWRLEVSFCNEGKYPKPWLMGERDDYVRQKGLEKGENGERIYRIRAERKHFGFWYSIDDQQ